MKRKIALVSMLLICLAISASGTLAYFTAEEYAHNVITTGGIGIEIIEKTKDSSGAQVDFPAGGISGVMPGMPVSKIVSVKNNGAADEWIRVKVEMSAKDTTGADLPLTLSGGVSVMNVVIDHTKWFDGQDGYYYYRQPVAPEALTEVLFDEVLFAPQMGNEYQNCTANIIVSAQAVQVANNEIPAGGDVTDVKGWPTEVTE